MAPTSSSAAAGNTLVEEAPGTSQRRFGPSVSRVRGSCYASGVFRDESCLDVSVQAVQIDPRRPAVRRSRRPRRGGRGEPRRGAGLLPASTRCRYGFAASAARECDRLLPVVDGGASTARRVGRGEGGSVVRALLPGSATCAVLVTSRRKLEDLLVSPEGHRLALGLLAPAVAREVLCGILGAARVRDGARPTVSPGSSRDVVVYRSHCGWLRCVSPPARASPSRPTSRSWRTIRLRGCPVGRRHPRCAGRSPAAQRHWSGSPDSDNRACAVYVAVFEGPGGVVE
jgi:hypothetical protein